MQRQVIDTQRYGPMQANSSPLDAMGIRATRTEGNAASMCQRLNCRGAARGIKEADPGIRSILLQGVYSILSREAAEMGTDQGGRAIADLEVVRGPGELDHIFQRGRKYSISCHVLVLVLAISHY